MPDGVSKLFLNAGLLLWFGSLLVFFPWSSRSSCWILLFSDASPAWLAPSPSEGPPTWLLQEVGFVPSPVLSVLFILTSLVAVVGLFLVPFSCLLRHHPRVVGWAPPGSGLVVSLSARTSKLCGMLVAVLVQAVFRPYSPPGCQQVFYLPSLCCMASLLVFCGRFNSEVMLQFISPALLSFRWLVWWSMLLSLSAPSAVFQSPGLLGCILQASSSVAASALALPSFFFSGHQLGPLSLGCFWCRLSFPRPKPESHSSGSRVGPQARLLLCKPRIFLGLLFPV